MTTTPPMLSFLPPETVEMIEKYGTDIPSDLAFDQEMIILFSDMRGFTEMADKYEPREVYATINASIAIQTRVIMRHGGSINKFLGDGLLACFSGKNRGVQALQCLLELIAELKQEEETNDRLPCHIGFGMHDGHVLFGLLGDELRKEFTVIGDVANTAARLCGIAQPFQGLMTEDCLRLIPESMAKKHCRYLNSVYFKGKSSGMEVFYVEL